MEIIDHFEIEDVMALRRLRILTSSQGPEREKVAVGHFRSEGLPRWRREMTILLLPLLQFGTLILTTTIKTRLTLLPYYISPPRLLGAEERAKY